MVELVFVLKLSLYSIYICSYITFLKYNGQQINWFNEFCLSDKIDDINIQLIEFCFSVAKDTYVIMLQLHG